MDDTKYSANTQTNTGAGPSSIGDGGGGNKWIVVVTGEDVDLN